MMRGKQKILLWMVAGWVFASVLANRVFASGLVNIQMLSELIQDRFFYHPEENRAGWFRLTIFRMIQTGMIAGICAGRFADIGIRLILFLTGACASAMLVLLTWMGGAKGLWLFFCASFPQDFLYLASWILLIAESVEYPNLCEKPYQKRIWLVSGILCVAGIWTEAVIGTWIFKKFFSF